MAGAGNFAGGGAKFDQAKIKDGLKNHFQDKVMVVDEIDRQVWQLISNVPRVNKYVSVAVAVINLLFPGFGTMIASCASTESVSKA